MSDPDGRVVAGGDPGGPAGRARPEEDCGYSITSEPTRIPLDGPLAFGGWWIRIGYLSTAATPGRVTAGDARPRHHLRAGLHALLRAGRRPVRLGGGLRVGPACLCTDDVTVVGRDHDQVTEPETSR